MSKAYISKQLRLAVERAAGRRCGYCLTPQAITGAALEIEHIYPEVAGGLTEEENLWLACTSCNRYKGSRTHGYDVVSGEHIPLFNPRRDLWGGHFTWSEDGTEIIGTTPCGRATVSTLRMNNGEMVGARSLWVQSGWWPPEA
ncbi:MAG: HNH endonuclease [Anaerolinea sp.]|nr:HNH endonuclease [Anaerolinea sp.]